MGVYVWRNHQLCTETVGDSAKPKKNATRVGRDIKFWRRQKEKGIESKKSLENALNGLDKGTKSTMDCMRIAAIYNRTVGSNLTHKDVDEWGMIEETEIMIALQYWDA